MTVSISAKSITFTNGTANDASQIDSEHTNLFNNDSSLATKVNTLLAGNVEDATTLTLNSTYTGSSPSNMAFMVERGTLANTGLRWNETTKHFELTNDGTNYTPLAAGLDFKKLILSGRPLYTTATTFTVSDFAMIDSTGALVIAKSSSTTVDITTFGLNGIAQSATLTGTVGTGGVASTTITGSGTSFTSQFQIGDVLYTASGSARITAIGGLTTLTVANALTLTNGTDFKRGGRANNTFYYLYATTDNTTPGLLVSTRNTANGTDVLVDFPSGSYTQYRQLPFFVLTDGSANILNFTVGGGWPNQPRIQYNVYFPGSCVPSTTQVLALSTGASFTTLSLSAFVPPISKLVWLHTTYQNGTTSSAAQIRQNGASHNGYEQYPLPSTLQGTKLFPMETDASQQIQYAQASLGNFYVFVHSVVITEVR